MRKGRYKLLEVIKPPEVATPKAPKTMCGCDPIDLTFEGTKYKHYKVGYRLMALEGYRINYKALRDSDLVAQWCRDPNIRAISVDQDFDTEDVIIRVRAYKDCCAATACSRIAQSAYSMVIPKGIPQE